MQYCQARGGYLAEIDCYFEQQYVSSLLSGHSWIGAHSHGSSTGNHFVWDKTGLLVRAN